MMFAQASMKRWKEMYYNRYKKNYEYEKLD